MPMASALAAHPAFRSDRRYRPAQIATLAAFLFLAAYSAGLLIRPSEGYLRIQSNLIYNLVPLAALCLSVIPVLRSRGRQRLGWLCLAAVLITWQAGDWTFTFYNFVKNTAPPFPGFADAAYYPGYLAFIAAIALLTFPEGRLQDRRWVIDAGVVMIVAGVLVWEFIMRPIIAQNEGGAFSAAVAVGYPLLDLGLLTTLVVTLYASGGRFSTAALALAAAGVFQIVSDGAYTYVLTTTGYDNVGNPMELGWLAAYLLLAVCFLLPKEPARRPASTRPSLLGAALPYAFGLPLLVLLIVTAVRGHPSLVLLGGAVATVGLIVLRQFLTLRENVALLTRAANFDEMTDLPNRRRFAEEVRRRLSENNDNAEGALVLLGLDDLKAVNDSLGRRAGDEVLTRAAEVLRGHAPANTELARLEGDEFVLFLPGTEPRRAEASAQKLLEALRERPTLVGGRLVRTTASAGIALIPQHGTVLDDLLSAADLATYEAKAAGGNRVRVYDAESGSQALSEARLVWKERIVDALERDRFVLYAQPIVSVRTRGIYEYELLIRMLDDDGRALLPTEFLDVAERFGLITEIDRWVVRQAVRLLADQGRLGADTPLAVNLSGHAFEDAELLPLIRRELAVRNVRPDLLTLEVTETAAIADMDRAANFIGSLKKLGCRFALDDFGVGFSSFSHLKQLPVDYLKIDGSFIRELPSDEVDQHLVRAMVDVARGLGRETIAEFVQDEATMKLLRELGVDYGQGFYLGRPSPALETLSLLRRAQSKAA
jgi:diguanylate cyclase (GGDEF)-like protein